jgi:hypothetical protein
MPTEPKPDSPEFYWLCHASELQGVLDPNDERFDQVVSFLYSKDMEFLTVSDFCTTEPGNPGDITSGDLSSGDYLNKYVQAARQAAFYKLCQDA